MPMDALRMSQIREALDDDKKMYGQAFDIVKRYVATTKDDPAVAYVQLNQDDIKSAGELIGTFQELLEKKLAEITTIIRTNSGEAPESDSEIGLVEDVINAYNKIISIAINPGNTQQTKQALMTEAMKSQATVARMEALLVHVLDRMAATNDETILKPGFGVFLKAYNVYNLINTQLATQRLVIITSGDLSHNIESIFARKPVWRTVMSRYNLKPPDYQPIAPEGASGQGPTPPRPPGGGPPGGGPGGGPFGKPSQDTKDVQTDQTGKDQGAQTDAPSATGDDFQDADEGAADGVPGATALSPTTVPALLPSGTETIVPSGTGPQAAAVPQPARDPAFPGGVPSKTQHFDISGDTAAMTHEEQLLTDERNAWEEQANRHEAEVNRLREQLTRHAPSQLASQSAMIPPDPFSGEHDEEEGEEDDTQGTLQAVNSEIEGKF